MKPQAAWRGVRGGRAEDGSQHLLPLQGFWGRGGSEDKAGKRGEKGNDMEKQNRSIKRGERRELAKGNKTRPLTLTTEGLLGIQTLVLQGESMGDGRQGGAEDGSAARAGGKGVLEKTGRLGIKRGRCERAPGQSGSCREACGERQNAQSGAGAGRRAGGACWTQSAAEGLGQG